MSRGRFCFLVRRYLNASLPRDSGRDRNCLLLTEPGAPEGACHHLFQILFPCSNTAGNPEPISQEPPYLCPVIGQGPLAPDERPGSPGPEMELSKARGWTGRLTGPVLSKAGRHLTGDTCFVLIYKPFLENKPVLEGPEGPRWLERG